MSQGKRLNRIKMKHDMFKHLPSEIVIDILSRLPVQSVIRCKCVRKSWLHLVETQEFVKSHLSKSIPGLIMQECKYPSKLYKFLEFEDGFNVEHHDLHYKLVAKFSTYLGYIKGSIDGLLFICKRDVEGVGLNICNPITREYINLHCPQEFQDPCDRVTWGFGSSKMTCQYKVVRIGHSCMFCLEKQEVEKTIEAKCHVYTLGTGLWRRCASCAFLKYNMYPSSGVFANGNLHWLVSDLDHCLRISCFDLEIEHFGTFSAPPLHCNGESCSLYMRNLFVSEGCLGLCDNSSADKIVIWLMKDYGVEKSWTKEIIISNVPKPSDEYAQPYPIKVFRDGDALIVYIPCPYPSNFIYYSSKTKTTQRVDMFKLPNARLANAFLHTPSFVSLKVFGLDVSSF